MKGKRFKPRSRSSGIPPSGLKSELDALANKDFQYLTKSYLPESSKRKIGWISPKEGKPALVDAVCASTQI